MDKKIRKIEFELVSGNKCTFEVDDSIKKLKEEFVDALSTKTDRILGLNYSKKFVLIPANKIESISITEVDIEKNV